MNGILLVDKPADWTSHDVVAKLRGVLGERRAKPGSDILSTLVESEIDGERRAVDVLRFL